MIISKQNLQVVEVTGPDKNIPVLDCVNILEDGSTVGGNGKSFIVVSPVPEEIKEKVSKVYGNEPSERVNVSSGTIKEVLKNMPADRKFNGMLEHTDVSGDESKVKFVLYDGARKRFINGKVNPATYPPFRKLFQNALNNKKQIQVKVNAKRFLPLLETLIKCSNDTTDYSPMYIEFTDKGDIIIRMENPRTGQRCIGIMWSYKNNEGRWMEYSEWEERFIDDNNNDNDNNASLVNNRNSKGSKSISERVELHSKRINGKGAKRTGNKQLARIIPDELCPLCNEYHLATDGKVKWCSCVRGCNFYERI